MKPTIRLVTRDWDYMVPLALGDVRSREFDVEVVRAPTLPENLAEEADYDAGEVSFSRFAQARAAGDESLVGIPHFLMRAFRHRCIITATDSPLTTVHALRGKRIGMTGWQDSGNVWTRAILRREGIGVDDAHWFVGRLTDAHAIVDRLGGFGRPGRIEAAPGERPMVELLRSGELDAVFTPFMPPGFFDAGSGLRQLLPQCRQAEVDYFQATGYVPGIHVLAMKPAVVQAHPWLPQALSALLDASADMWIDKRRKYADTTPWIIDELRSTARDLPDTWNANGYPRNAPMVRDFCEELHAQGITPTLLDTRDLFPQFAH